MAKKRVLGMGLGDLLGDIENVYDKAFEGDSKNVVSINVESIAPNPMQPRLSFDADEIAELAQSIKEHGLLQPIIVVRCGLDSMDLQNLDSKGLSYDMSFADFPSTDSPPPSPPRKGGGKDLLLKGGGGKDLLRKGEGKKDLLRKGEGNRTAVRKDEENNDDALYKGERNNNDTPSKDEKKLKDSKNTQNLNFIESSNLQNLDSKAKFEYFVVAGERRLRAVKSLNFSHIDSIIVDLETLKLREIALIENIQRRDLNAIELALCFSALIKEHNLTHEQLAKKVAKSRTLITNTLRLLELSDETQDLIQNGKITPGHARALIGLSRADEKIATQSILGQNLSVRETERLAARMKNRLDSKDSVESIEPKEQGRAEKKANMESNFSKELEILKKELLKFDVNATISNNAMILKFDNQSSILKIIAKLQNS